MTSTRNIDSTSKMQVTY